MKSEQLELSILLAIGCLWGLNEVIFKAYLHTIPAFSAGSILTGLTFFFLAFGIGYNRKPHTLVILLGVATGFKLLDARLIGIPICYTLNPVFALVTQTLAFIGIYKVLDNQLKEKLYGKSILGVLSALVAINVFPLVKYFTGNPACVVAGTHYPRILYYAPLSLSISIFTCPLGMVLGEKLSLVLEKKPEFVKTPIWAKVCFPSLSTLALIILVLFRTL